MTMPAAVPAAAPMAAPAASEAGEGSASSGGGAAPAGGRSDLLEVKSPMVGTFYHAPEPGAKPYVAVGDRIAKGQMLCIIEAMKIMNEIESEFAGVVVEVRRTTRSRWSTARCSSGWTRMADARESAPTPPVDAAEFAAPAGGGGSASGPTLNFKGVLQQMVQAGASDLHLKVGRPPTLRVNGELQPLPLPPLRPDELTELAKELMTPRQIKEFAEQREADFASGVPGMGRFRVNVFQQRGTIAFAFRTVPHHTPLLTELNLPPVVGEIALRPRGLVLVTGVTGSGKSTALAAMIQHINESRHANIITIEDPIEFLHRDINSHINQREVGTDTGSFAQALRRVLRQDPDVILIGEIRDLETLDTALKAADTGHLVFSTLHTTDASQTINRVLSFYPPHQQAEVRFMLSSALAAVVSLRLVPRADRPGRVPAARC